MTQTDPQILTPSDFADTGQWHLAVYVRDKGLEAWLRNTADSRRPLVKVASVEWDPEGDAYGALLRNIENAVYDHPALLDDYATDIILESRRTTWIPNTIFYGADYDIEEIFTDLYPGENQEIISDTLKNPEATVLFSFASGLDSFLSRTIPGARLRSHLGVMVERFLNYNSSAKRIFINIRKDSADIVLFNGESFLCAVSKPVSAPADAAYYALQAITAFGLNPKEVQAELFGDSEMRSQLENVLASHIRRCVAGEIPTVSVNSDMPLAAAMILNH